MKAEEVSAIAESADTPTFLFGSKELANWHQRHWDLNAGRAFKDSGFYVVRHRSLKPECPDFKVLSFWHSGRCVPNSWDVPQKRV